AIDSQAFRFCRWLRAWGDSPTRDLGTEPVRGKAYADLAVWLHAGELFFREAGLAVKSSSFLDLGVTARTTLAIVFLSVQAALLVTAGDRPDGIFAFR